MFSSSPSSSGPRTRRVIRSGGNAALTSSGVRSSSLRTVANSPMRSPPSRRRKAKRRASRDGASSHCASSIATTVDPPRLEMAASAPRATVTRSSGSVAPARRSATSSASRCGAGSEASVSCGMLSRRSASATYGSPASTSAGRQSRTRNERERADANPARQSVDLPMPGAPATSKAAGPACSESRKASTAAISVSRPITSGPPVDKGSALVVTATSRLECRPHDGAYRDSPDSSSFLAT
jgi:hypothetical protein